MEERYQCKVTVDLLLERIDSETNEKEILLLLRKNTGYCDGFYDLPGGHLEANEDLFDGMIREAKEEIGIDLKRENLKIAHIYHAFTKDRLKFVFTSATNNYEPINSEPDQCAKLEWFNINNLPENIIPAVKIKIDNVKNDIFYDKD